jgi:hypothetical protein
VPPRGGEARVAAVERVGDRHAVHHDQPLDCLGVLHRHAERHVAAAVVAGDGEALVAERAHQLQPVARHRPLRVRLVVGCRRRLRRLPVPAQVGADDGEAGRQQRRHAVPGDVRARVAVEQQQRRAGAAVAHAQHRLPDVGALEREAFEHGAPHARSERRRTAPGR